jgi:hypothetical protein
MTGHQTNSQSPGIRKNSSRGWTDALALDILLTHCGRVCFLLQVERVIQQVLERHRCIDGVVNCVGSVVARSAVATDLAELHDTLDVSCVTIQHHRMGLLSNSMGIQCQADSVLGQCFNLCHNFGKA